VSTIISLCFHGARHSRELWRLLDQKFKNLGQETIENLVMINGQNVQFLFQPTGSGKNLNLLLPERQITSEQLKRPNVSTVRQIYRCIIFFKDSDRSLWRSRAKLFFQKRAKSRVKQTELEQHPWQVSGQGINVPLIWMTTLLNRSRTVLLYSKKRTLP